jgi:hypothetical protein
MSVSNQPLQFSRARGAVIIVHHGDKTLWADPAPGYARKVGAIRLTLASARLGLASFDDSAKEKGGLWAKRTPFSHCPILLEGSGLQSLSSDKWPNQVARFDFESGKTKI